MKEFLVIMNQDDDFPPDLPFVLQAESEEEVKNYISKNSNIRHIIIDLDENEIKTFKLVRGKCVISHDDGEDDGEDDDKNVNGTYWLNKLTYSIHKKNGEKILKASYNVKTEKGWIWTSKFLCFDRPGWAREKAFEWANERLVSYNKDFHYNNEKITTEFVLSMSENEFAKPTHVELGMNKQGYPEIITEIWR